MASTDPTPGPGERRPRLRRRVRGLGDVADLALAACMAVLAVAIAWVDLQEGGHGVGPVVTLGFGLLPSILLWIGTKWSMLALALFALPCCAGAYVVCDGGGENAVLHVAHDW